MYVWRVIYVYVLNPKHIVSIYLIRQFKIVSTGQKGPHSDVC